MSTASLTSVSIIVPTYKEAENLPLLIPQVAAAMRARNWMWEIIIVDDNSPDATVAVLEDLQKSIPNVRYLVRTKDRGLSSAVLAGISIAHNDYIVVMDADLSHPPESIPDLIDKLLSNEADFVIGSRYCQGGCTQDWSVFRWLNSYVATLMAKPLVGTVRDPMSGFFALRREALRTADPLNPIGYKIGLELIAKTGLTRVAEVPIVFRNRIHGESKLTLKEQFRYLEHLSRLYDYKFPKGSPRLKFLIAAGTGAVACYSAVFLSESLGLPGFASIAAGLLAMIAVTLAFFVRYVRTQRDFIVMQNPFSEFTYISMAEFLAGWCFAIWTQPANVYLQMTVGLTIQLLVRYTLRKVFLHDIRGIRGTPKPATTAKLQLTPRYRPAASA